jgi:hypothetical protein
MDLGAPKFVTAHGVLGLGTLLPPQADLDETFVAAVRHEFPNVISRQPPLSGMPPNAPRIVLSSTSAQLALSPAQADFEVGFYGDYPNDTDRCISYIERKMEAIRRGIAAIGLTPATVGVIATLQYSFKDLDVGPIEHLLRTLLRSDADPSVLQEAQAKLAFKVRDKYFLNLTASNYESRLVQRAVMAGGPPVMVKPWEGTVEDVGVQLIVDINNNLEARVRKADAEVTETGVQAVLSLLAQVVGETGQRFVSDGQIAIDQLVEEPA